VTQLTPALLSLHPTNAQVGGVLHYGSASSAPVAAASVADITPLAASFNTTWEVGYKGIIGQRLRVALDLWYQIRGDVGAPIGQINPGVFMDPAKLSAYLPTALTQALIAGGMSQAQAQGTVAAIATPLITVMAGLPQGTLAFTNTKLAPDQSIIASYTNGQGQIDVRGADFAVDYQLNDLWMLGATYSNIGQNVFPQIGGSVNPLMSNSPKHRASGTATYTNNATGWGFDGSIRYADAFPVNSGLFNSLGSPPNTAGTALYAPIPANTMFDIGVSYKLPIQQNVTWSLAVTDLLDTRVQTFVGVPQIGRLISTRIRYSF
jgi:outer membrane receptor for ferrienterochelin and colicins